MNKHIAQLPNGQIATRNSKTRTYTHMVAGRRSADQKREAVRKELAYQVEQIVDLSAKLEKLRAGEWRWTYNSGQNIYDTVEQDIAAFEEMLQTVTERAERLQTQLDADEFADSWCDLGWCGRADLAEKKAATESKHYAEVIIIEAQAA